MSTKRYKPERIVNLLRTIQVQIANGKTTPQAAREVRLRHQPTRVRQNHNSKHQHANAGGHHPPGN